MWRPAEKIYSHLSNYRQHEFLEFVLGHYVARGVTELDPEKLPQLIELKYHTVRDAVRELGPVGSIREVFVGFKRSCIEQPQMTSKLITGL